MTDKKFDFEIIAEGSFKSEGYTVRTISIRLNSTALNEYILSSAWNEREVYETDEEYEEYKRRKKAEREQWERKILDRLKFTSDTGYSITKSVSEIFAVVLFKKQA